MNNARAFGRFASSLLLLAIVGCGSRAVDEVPVSEPVPPMENAMQPTRPAHDDARPVPPAREEPAEMASQTGHVGKVNSIAFSPDGGTLVSGAEDRTAMLWDVTTGLNLRTFGGHADAVNAVAFSPDGKRILTGSSDGTAILWELTSGAKLRSFRGQGTWVKSVAFSSDGSKVLIGASGRREGKSAIASLWDVVSGEKLTSFASDKAGTYVAISPDGSRVLTGSRNGTCILWNSTSGEQLREFPVQEVCAVAFSPDGTQVLTGIEGHTLTFPEPKEISKRLKRYGEYGAILWDTNTGAKLRSFSGHRLGVTSVAFSRDGKRILTGSQDDSSILWDSTSGQKIREFRGHKDQVWTVAVSPDNCRLGTASWDGAVILWDAGTGQQLQVFASRKES